MGMGLVDTVMLGWVSATDLAAVALGNLYFIVAAVFGTGILWAIDPLMSQAVGAGDREGAARAFQRGLLLVGVLTLVVMLFVLPAAFVFRISRQPPEIAEIAWGYLLASLPGVLPFLLFVLLRVALQAQGRVAPILWTAIAANGVNLGLNWVLIWGNLGVPSLGAVGSAWATSLSRWFLALALLYVARRHLLSLARPWLPGSFDLRALGRVFLLGGPIAIQMQLEFGAFAVIGLLMGWLGAESMAGHQVALNLASFTFMIPVGIGASAAVRVGHEIGRGDVPAARRGAVAALLLGVAFMSAAALSFLAFPRFLGGLFSPDEGVIRVAALLLPIAGVFQIFDGLQAVAAGILRGTGDTRAPMVAMVVGFWLVGLPLSIWLGFGRGWGAAGLWWGLALGLAAVALLLLVRVWTHLGGELQRIHVDGEESR